MEKIDLNSRGFGISGSRSDIKNYNAAYSDYVIDKHNTDEAAHSGLIAEVKAYTDEKLEALRADLQAGRI